MTTSPRYYIGMMSGTSMDGVDAVLADFSGDAPRILGSAYTAFPAPLFAQLLTLQASSVDEIHVEAMASNALVAVYAECVNAVLQQSSLRSDSVQAIGVHGQTIRHRPECGYTRQVNNPARLAELCGIDVIADFRSRDIAAGGQGAPLVPAFHATVFGHASQHRVIINIGGISNITVLPADGLRDTKGYDTGPGNVLMDGWIARHQGVAYDADGAWAAQGKVDQDLLRELCAEEFFSRPPPKSTGRDLFHLAWLDQILATRAPIGSVDVQATLAQLTATSLAEAIWQSAPNCQAAYVCGGGALNGHLMRTLEHAFKERGCGVTLHTTNALGVAPHLVEALAFAWLAKRFTERQSGNLPDVTGARGFRILGALYPA